jgi:hypothetical protein
MPEKSNDKILRLLEEKVLLKQEVLTNTTEIFGELKKLLSELTDELKSSVKKISKEIPVNFKDNGEYEAEFTLADETLLFAMHTNVFTFDSSHEIWKTKYVQQDTKRAYCGKIFIYNFLSDSFRYNRVNDVGYLISRIFVNREKHYFVEGKKQMDYLYSDFPSTVLDTENIMGILESAILYSLDFDPFTMPFNSVSSISVRDIMEASLQSRIETGKRLGFQFEKERGGSQMG